MTRTHPFRRRRRGPARLVLLAAAGIGVGVARYALSKSSGPAPADERPPTPKTSSSDSSAGSSTSTPSSTSATSDSGGSAQQPSSVQQGVRSERLALEDEWGAGPLDGAWWPESADAAQAVPNLVEALPDELRVSRVALPMPDWSDEQPKTLQLDDRTIHLAWFAGMQRHTARITFETGDAVTVLVLPSDTEAEAASKVLSQANEKRSREDLLAEAGVEA